MQIGIVGLPSSGKTTLFQTMTRTHLDEAALPRKQANLAVVKVPDPRVEALAEVFKPKKRVLTSIEFVDLVGLNKGDRDSTQFTSSFLNNVKTNDALIHVVRLFDDEVYPHPEGSLDPARDVRLLEEEFLLADMALVESKFERLRKPTRTANDPQAKLEVSALEKCYAALEKEQPLRTLELAPDEARVIRGYQFLSAKPMLVVLNLSEDRMGQEEQHLGPLRGEVRLRGPRLRRLLRQSRDGAGAVAGGGRGRVHGRVRPDRVGPHADHSLRL